MKVNSIFHYLGLQLNWLEYAQLESIQFICVAMAQYLFLTFRSFKKKKWEEKERIRPVTSHTDTQWVTLRREYALQTCAETSSLLRNTRV